MALLAEHVRPVNTFVEECEAAGIQVETYRGRAYWFGPAARASDMDDVIRVARATTMRLQWDSPLVYPAHSDEAWYNTHKDDPDYTGWEDADEYE